MDFAGGKTVFPLEENGEKCRNRSCLISVDEYTASPTMTQSSGDGCSSLGSSPSFGTRNQDGVEKERSADVRIVWKKDESGLKMNETRAHSITSSGTSASLVDLSHVDVSRYVSKYWIKKKEEKVAHFEGEEEEKVKIQRIPNFRKQRSFTEEFVGVLADGSRARPRGFQSALHENIEDGSIASFTTRAHRARIYRSPISRLLYCITLLNIVVWTPLWLKLMTLRRHETRKDKNLILYNESIQLDLHVSTFDENTEIICTACQADQAQEKSLPIWGDGFSYSDKEARTNDKTQNSFYGITYDVSADVYNFEQSLPVSTPTHVVLLASIDFNKWYTVSRPGIFTGLRPGTTKNIEICRSDTPIDADTLAAQDEASIDVILNRAISDLTNYDSSTNIDPEKVSSFTTTYRIQDGIVTEDMLEIITEWTTKEPHLTDTPESTSVPTALEDTVLDEDYHSRCCLDQPGFIYFVACLTPFEYLHKSNFYTQIDPPTFESQCIALDGKCGSTCGISAKAPQKDTCTPDGKIPRDLLIDSQILNDNRNIFSSTTSPQRRKLSSTMAKKHVRFYDARYTIKSRRTKLYLNSFVTFITLMLIGTWISFFAGTGYLDEPLKPSMSEVEAYLATPLVQQTHHNTMKPHTVTNTTTNKKHIKKISKRPSDETSYKQPLCLVAFSISASEPRMMVLRNMCGKLMSWIYQRKFTLAVSSTFGTRATHNENHPLRSKNDPYKQRVDTLKRHVETIDIFEDEGHRVGTYALWDAFVETVNGSDLRFIEIMADKMANMTASDDSLHGNGDDSLLDDDLRSMLKQQYKKQEEQENVQTHSQDEQLSNTFVIREPEKTKTNDASNENKDNVWGISQKEINRLELAFTTYSLLNELGHHAFWRRDELLNVVAFRDLADNQDAVATLTVWAKNYKNAKQNFLSKYSQGGNSLTPFSRHVVPTDAPGIDHMTWNSWWELYNEQGRQQHNKRYDCTKFRLIRVYYDRQHTGDLHHRDIMMCYAARANPEDLKNKLGPTLNLRGITKGCFVRLKTAESNENIRLFSGHGLGPLSRSEARRCHARVCSKFFLYNPVTNRNEYHVKIKECTPELLRLLPTRFLIHAGAASRNDDDDDDTFENTDSHCFQDASRDYLLARNSLYTATTSRNHHDTITKTNKMMLDVGCLPSPKHVYNGRDSRQNVEGIDGSNVFTQPQQQQQQQRRSPPVSAYFQNLGHNTKKAFAYASKIKAVKGEEAILPVSLIQPLRESRGKSGGMNHAMEILNYYIRHHSSTMQVMRANNTNNSNLCTGIEPRSPISGQSQLAKVPEDNMNNIVSACLLFAIFDCRHMAVQGFWDAVIPYFYGYKHHDNPWSRDLIVDRSVAFVQLPQSFTSLTIENDIFDMRNEYLFRLANNVRSGVGAITSCGTNAVWNYDIKMQRNPLEHRFNELTMIEDTASSHDVIMAGRKGIYHFERLVLGAKKGTSDYLSAVFRWSRGAVQLSWITFWYPLSKEIWPYIILLLHILPIIGCVAYLQNVKLNSCNTTSLGLRLGLAPCHSGPFVGLLLDPIYLIYVILMVTSVVSSFFWSRIGSYIVMFENITYFFTSTSAFYWCAIPPYMCIAKNGIPGSIFDTILLTAGALWLQLNSAVLIYFIKIWSPLENGNAPSDQSLLRSQQMYILTAPLHAMAIIAGCYDGIHIVFGRKDASRWSSFDSVMSLSLIKIWILGLAFTLLFAICYGIFHIFTIDYFNFYSLSIRLLGIFFCFMLLFLIQLPLRALFFYNYIIKQTSKLSYLDIVTKAIFGQKHTIRPDFVYLLLWIILLAFSLRLNYFSSNSSKDYSTSILNSRKRCSSYTSSHHNDAACIDFDIGSSTRIFGKSGHGLGQY